MRRYLAGVTFWIVLFGGAVSAQVANKIDFQRDVQPIFKANCVGCHGPAMQKNSFRLDRRRDALRGGTISVIGPGNSAGSRLYLRLIGSDFGLQMPPRGPLAKQQVEIIKNWIDQGAPWPDEVAGETVFPPPDAQATRIMEALRNNDRAAFTRALREFCTAINRNGPGGSTPLMYAVLYGNAESVRRLLKAGADPNLKNNAGATALMWALNDLEKTELLITAGADVNAQSDDGQTPLLIGASYFGAGRVVKLLLDHGANPSVKVSNATGEMTPLSEAGLAGDADVVQMLLEHGADVKQAGFFAMTYATFSRCVRCIDLLAKRTEPADLNMAMFFNAPPLNDPQAARQLIDRGADIKATDPEGRTVLMLAAASATLPVGIVKDLIERGAEVNTTSARGDTALDFARRHGQTPIVDLLLKAGAKEGNPSPQAFIKPTPAASIRAAVNRSIPLLQRADVSFLQKSGCVSCHHNTLTAMTMATVRQNGFQVDEQIARSQLKAISGYLDGWRERVLQSIGIPGDSDTISYLLLGLAAENHPADSTTDALARYLKNKQSPDGSWLIFAHRPPIESSDFEVTAASMQALQVYAPKAQRAEYDKAIQLATRWLLSAQPKTIEDRAFQLLGFAWAFTDPAARRMKSGGSNNPGSTDTAFPAKAARELLAEQRADGGWAQLPSLQSDAYATGLALVALNQARLLAASDPAYKRAVQFLLNTQIADGSWYVKSRALPLQPFFESGFPHGRDQWVSAAATNWATMALARAQP